MLGSDVTKRCAPCSAIVAATAAGASAERRAGARQSGQQEEAFAGRDGRLRAQATAKEKGELFRHPFMTSAK